MNSTILHDTEMTLQELPIRQAARILHVGGEGTLRQQFLDMGLIPGEQVEIVKYAPMGDPIELRLHGYELTLRKSDATQIEVSPTEEFRKESTKDTTFFIPNIAEHPGFGEDGPRFHSKDTENLSNSNLTIVIAGNQNTGKTMLFNQLTGSNQHVGNFPGVTTERQEGTLKEYPYSSVVDMPGIYSLSPYNCEAFQIRQFILEERPMVIINIADASNIERNLYLTLQLMELGKPIVLALNMMDEVRNNGGTIRVNIMERLLGIPVIPISAIKNEGVDEVITHALHVGKYQEGPSRQDFCSPEDHGGAVHRCLHAIMHLIEDHALRAHIPVRFAASRLIEGDTSVKEVLHLDVNEVETVEHIVRQMEEERGLDRQAAMADMRYSYIHRICQQTVIKPNESLEYRRSQRIDNILTGRWTALPAFISIMALIFWLTFDGIGGWMQELAEQGIEWFTRLCDQMLSQWNIAPMVRSLIIDGVFNGVGTVLSFLPVIICLFFFLSMLEDTGYMARIAFVMDRILRRLGLSGRSIVPLLIGFGCSVPSVMASRSLPSERDRRLTILLTPFMSCTAKIPVYAFFASAFFARQAGWVMMGLYLIGILSGVLMALLLKRTLFKGEAVPFVMELPHYRMPVVKSVSRLLWDKSKDFLQNAFTVIFAASIIIWFLQSFTFQLQMVQPGMEENSILAQSASLLVPIFRPIGLGDWRIVTSLVSGLLAKEVVVSTLGTLFSGIPLSHIFTKGTALCMMVFCLLYTPCIATIATIRRELGTRWALSIVCGQCGLAWIVSLLLYVVVINL